MDIYHNGKEAFEEGIIADRFHAFEVADNELQELKRWIIAQKIEQHCKIVPAFEEDDESRYFGIKCQDYFIYIKDTNAAALFRLTWV